MEDAIFLGALGTLRLCLSSERLVNQVLILAKFVGLSHLPLTGARFLIGALLKEHVAAVGEVVVSAEWNVSISLMECLG